MTVLHVTTGELKCLSDARIRWGQDFELRMAMEELAETITAICHFDRGRVPIQKVIEEMGDAIVCTAQVIHSETGSLDALESAIAISFGKLRAKLEMDDPDYREESSAVLNDIDA